MRTPILMNTQLFSDRYRFWVFFTILILLFCLGVYSQTVGIAEDESSQQKLIGCLSNRSECPQETIVLSAQVIRIGQDYMVVNVRTGRGVHRKDQFNREFDLVVTGEEFGLEIGNTIALKGKFTSPNRFMSREYENEAPWVREIKYGISILGLILTTLMFWQTFYFSRNRIAFVRRKFS